MTDETIAPVVETPAVEADAKPVETPTPQARDRVQERIDELTREKNDLRRRLESLEKPKPEPVKELKEPTLEQFGYDEEKHRQAVREYDRAVAKEEARKEALEVLRKEREAEKARVRDESFASKFGKLSADERDIANRATVTEFTANLIKESDVGPQVVLYLGQNPEVAESILRLPEHLQAREIGRIEAKLDAKPSEKSEAPQVSKAPPPVPKIEATEASIEKDPSNMTDKEFAKWRRKQIEQRS